MQYKHKKNHKSKQSRLILIISVGFVLVAVGILLYLVFKNQSSPVVQPRNDAAQTESSKNKVIDDKTNTKTSNDTKSSLPSTVEQPTNGNSDTATISIESVAQNNRQITVNTSIKGSTQSGTCIFTFNNSNAKPVIRQVVSDSKNCTTTIPEVEFSVIGVWKLNVSYYYNQTKIAEDSKDVTIN